MITPMFASRFAQDWIAAWNSHSLARILEHYADDFEFASPYIAHTGFAAAGRLRGKAGAGAYWAAGLKRLPDLHFELQGAYAGVSSVALQYRGAQGRMAIEVFDFNAQQPGKVIRGAAHYAA